MGTVRWTGNATPVAEVDTFTPSVPAVGNTFTLTCNGKTITFTATATTTANVSAGLVALVQGTKIAEFLELLATDLVGTLTLTARTPGVPFTVTSSAAAGSGGGAPTLSRAATTVSAGPNDWAVAANWSTGAVPIAGDDVVFDQSSISCLWNLDQHTIIVNSDDYRASFTGLLGLPLQNAAGYAEYRPTYLQLQSPTTTIGDGPGSGSPRLKRDFGSVTANTTTVYNTAGNSIDPNVEPVLLKGTNASNTLTRLKGNVGVAVDTSSTAVLATVKSGDASNSGSLRLGSGCTLTTVTNNGGTLLINSACTTLTVNGGTVTVYGTGAYTTVTAIERTTLVYSSTGTITTLNATGTVDFTQDVRARTVTNCNVYAGANLKDTFKTVTWTNGLVYTGGAFVADTTLDVGPNRTLTIA